MELNPERLWYEDTVLCSVYFKGTIGDFFQDIHYISHEQMSVGRQLGCTDGSTQDLQLGHLPQLQKLPVINMKVVWFSVKSLLDE